MILQSRFRRKLVALSMAVLVCYHLLVILMSILFMEPYYLHRVETLLVSAYKTVAAMDTLDAEALEELEQKNLSFVIADRNDMTVYYNSMLPPNILHDMTDRVLPFIKENASKIDTGYFVNTDTLFRRPEDGGQEDGRNGDPNVGPNGGPNGGPNDGVRRVTLGGVTNQYLVDISLSYAAIDQAVSITMQFSILIGMIIILAGIIAYARIATSVTTPVLQITNVANKIAHLDFSETCDVSTNDEIGEMAKSINTMSDFMQSHIAQLEDANRQLKADLAYRQEQNNARNNLLANLSHDLKTPIGLISGYADGLRHGMAKNEQEVNEYCEVIIDESERMMNLIVRMMELFRLESGSVSLEPEEFDLSELLNYTVDIFDIEITRAGLQFSSDYSDELYIHADYFAVEQVITNYMQNAISHMGEGKVLRLSVIDQPETYRVCVFNSSEPIEDSEINLLWDAFYRGDKSRTRSRRESGLGLSIVRSNMELMGGAYGCTNRDDGIEFWAEFAKSPPLTQAAEDALEESLTE